MKARLGFTMVELLVVIAVISVLAAVVYASFSGARDSAVNRALMSEMKEMQLALELYKSQNGQYPPINMTAGSCRNISGNIDAAFNTSPSPNCGRFEYIVGLAPDFIAELPRSSDSSNSNCLIRYEVENTNFDWFKLTAENCFAGATQASEGIQPDSEFSRCPSSCTSCDGTTYNAAYEGTAAFYESIAVYSNGGQCE